MSPSRQVRGRRAESQRSAGQTRRTTTRARTLLAGFDFDRSGPSDLRARWLARPRRARSRVSRLAPFGRHLAMATMVGAAPSAPALTPRGPGDRPTAAVRRTSRMRWRSSASRSNPRVAACVAHLERADPRFPAMPLHQRVEACYLQFLEADLNLAGAGSLPNPFPPGGGCPDRTPAVPSRRRASSRGDCPPGGRGPERRREPQRALRGEARAPDRVMKLALTDGRTRVTAYEYRPVPALGPSRPAASSSPSPTPCSPRRRRAVSHPGIRRRPGRPRRGPRRGARESPRAVASAERTRTQPRPNRRRGTDEGSEPRSGPGGE